MDNYISGSNRIQTVVVDRAFETVTQIGSCLGMEYTAVLSEAGAWSARFPANDARTSRVLLKKHFLDFYLDGRKLVRGLVEHQSWELSNDGQQIIVFSGRDLLAELDEVPIEFLLASGGLDPEPTDEAISIIVNKYNELVTGFSGSVYTWFSSGDNTETLVYARYAGESSLSALRRVAEQTGESFRLIAYDHELALANSERHFQWLGTATASSGVRAIGTVGDSIAAENNPFICLIQQVSERRDASRMLNRIYPYGSGLGDTRLDLEGISAAAAARIVAAGFTYNAADNSITSDAALTYIGKLVARYVNFKEIRPIFNTDADVQYAKDFLADAAIAYLQRNDDIDDGVEYDLQVIKLPDSVMVGMTLRVVWQDELREIDEDLVVLGIRRVVGSNGEVTYTITVATQNQWRLRESNNIVAQIEESQILGGHPQIDATAYWMPFKEIVGDDQTNHMAEFPFWLSAEIVTIRQVLFRFRVDQALIGVKTYTLATDTDQNVAADTGDESADITGDVFPASQPTGDESADVTGDAFPDSITDGSSITTTESGPDATTGVIGLPVGFNTDNGSPVGTGPALPDAITGNGSIAGDPHTHDFTHTHDLTHTHPAALPDHIHGTDHEHVMDHSHDFAHTHPFPHTHPMPHTHEFPHTHPAPIHTHPLPALTSSYAVELIPALNSYAIAELEFAVNGGAFYGLDDLDYVVPVAGGYSEVDITGAPFSIQNPAGLKRPYQEYNYVQVRRKTAAVTGKSAQIKAQIGIRATIQSIVLYE